MLHSHVWLAPPALKWIGRVCRGHRLRVLDVGCGYGSPLLFKRFFPDCEYHGLDRSKRWLLADDEPRMYRFYEVDLQADKLDSVPDSYFDAIVVSHVIEHLWNAESCLRELPAKLRPGGIIYVEYPGVKSLRVPRARHGFLHFHDDPTHVRVYSITDICNVFLRAGCTIVNAGTRRDPLRLLLSPVLAARGLILHRNIWSGRLWDLFGIAEFVVAQRMSSG